MADTGAPPPKNQLFHIKVYSPFQVYFDDDAASISAENDTGPFDVLPHHKNFLTLLTACDLVIATKDKKEQRIQITQGIMLVKADEATVFLDA